MRFKLDENLPAELLADFRSQGHEADSVSEEGLQGAPDLTVLEAVLAERRVLLTLDKGVAYLVLDHRVARTGVVLFRPGATGRRAIADFIRSRLPQLLLCPLEDRVTVVSETRIRIR